MLLYNYIIGLMLFQYFVISFILFTLVHIHKYSMAITYFSFLNLYLGIFILCIHLFIYYESMVGGVLFLLRQFCLVVYI